MNDVISRLHLFEFDEPVNATVAALLAGQLQEAEALGFEAEVPTPSDLAALAAEDHPPLPSKALRALRRALSRVREDYPFVALLADGATPHPTQPDVFDVLLARSVQIAIGLAQLDEECPDDILNVCRRAWRLLDEDFKGVIEHLPTFDQPLGTIAEALDALSNTNDGELTPFAGRFKAWARSLRLLSDGRTKHRVTAPGTPLRVPGQARDVALDDEADVEVTLADAPVDTAYPNAPEESRHDRPKEGTGARVQGGSDAADRSNGIVHVRGEQILNRQFMQFASPPAHPARLTEEEARRALQASYDRAATSSGYLFAALTVLTGRPAEYLAELPLVEGKLDGAQCEYFLYRNRTLALYYRPQLPAFESLTALGILDVSPDAGLAMPIPPALAKPLLAYLRRPRRPPIRHDLTEAVGQLVNMINPRITALRLSRVMKHALTSEGVDEVDVALLAGVAPEHCAGLYYSVVPRARLIEHYCSFVAQLLKGHKDQKGLTWPPPPKGVVGSRLRIPEDAVARFFHQMADALNEARQHQSACDLYEFHNRYLVYTVSLLSLCSAIRSVTEPFGGVLDLNPEARTLRLADKANREGSCDRLVPLPPIAVAQVTAFNAHLDQLRREVRDVDPLLARSISRALSGEAAWLFYFDARHRPQVVTPKWILTRLRHTWPLPTNWPRHFLSGWLREQGFARGVVRAFLGHSDLGAAPLSDFDGTSMFELRALADALAGWLDTLNIGVMDGWNTVS